MNRIKLFLKEKMSPIRIIILFFPLISIVFVSQDAFLYNDPIIKVTTVKTKKHKVVRDVRSGKENIYRQKIKGVVLNGKHKGEKVYSDNYFEDSKAFKSKYKKGDKVFVQLTTGEKKCILKGHKRDTYLVALVGFLLN